ncbi:MAG: 50S ribosomal protein L2 [Candidatus Nealsonbacteria bacterium CG23_combo_of_CG06-09_8_20_14_all_36_12]|uniref:Large ribosomal subunit protein uL2 n=2 Tax=Candidatus Nealsoniibacteriota TaxID=1817911 RepID=A0A2H0TL35_9BACT|nr:MAG: 50S ribosomal protein L2 [Candidatus Nealsonbacteria bacterium CG23_combo_of_CG06-09_8_20_14_all_36_12]PIR72863.1 MAG: 50S ribosomal protein L2 [Candidatus Nealsonbacteria bacterium CG10_big_fil_rev_8_21_14_0_10_36_23]
MKNKLLTKKEPEKKLLLALKKRAGRARSGRITVRHRGGGVKRLYRIIDFGQEKLNIPAKVVALEYDPYRTAFLALLQYKDGENRYILAPQDLKVGDEIIIAEKTELQPGNRMKLKNIPVGTMVYNVEIELGKGGKLIRGAGAGAKILAQEGKYTHLELPSSEIRKIPAEYFTSIGMVSNPKHIFQDIGKAGRVRLKGKRPTVRGTVMNPPDHPHGGGEGRTTIGLKHPKTPWGKPALGVKTRKRKKWTNKFIIQRRRKKKKK